MLRLNQAYDLITQGINSCPWPWEECGSPQPQQSGSPVFMLVTVKLCTHCELTYALRQALAV